MFVQKTKMFNILFLLLSLKVKTLQLRSIVYIISMRVQKKPHSWLLNRKSFWFIGRTRLYLLKQSMTWLDLNHDFFKMKIFNPFIIFHYHSWLIGEGVKSDTLLQFGARWSHTLFGHFFGVICCGSHPLPFFHKSLILR